MKYVTFDRLTVLCFILFFCAVSLLYSYHKQIERTVTGYYKLFSKSDQQELPDWYSTKDKEGYKDIQTMLDEANIALMRSILSLGADCNYYMEK